MNQQERDRAIRTVLWGRKELDREEKDVSSTRLMELLKALSIERSESPQGHEIKG